MPCEQCNGEQHSGQITHLTTKRRVAAVIIEGWVSHAMSGLAGRGAVCGYTDSFAITFFPQLFLFVSNYSSLYSFSSFENILGFLIYSSSRFSKVNRVHSKQFATENNFWILQAEYYNHQHGCNFVSAATTPGCNDWSGGYEGMEDPTETASQRRQEENYGRHWHQGEWVWGFLPEERTPDGHLWERLGETQPHPGGKHPHRPVRPGHSGESKERNWQDRSLLDSSPWTNRRQQGL